MSDQTNDTNNQKLKELLDKTGQPDAGPDDFEKEALEGFAMLGSEDALKLKEELDAKLYPALLKRKNTAPYWLAAAALILIIGFSVFFVNTSSEKEADQLAIDAVTEQAPPPPAEIHPLEETQVAEKQVPEKKPAATKSKYLEAEKNAEAGERHAANPLSAKQITSKKNEELPSEPPVNAGVQSAAQAAPPTEPVTAADHDVAVNEAEAQVEGNWVSAKKTDLATAPQLSSGSTIEMSKSMSYNAAPATLKPTYRTAPACYYTGGEEALKKDLTVKLSAKNLLQKFDAVLSVNSDKAVEKVKFKNTYGLSSGQQQQVTDILRSLDKFEFSVASAGKKTAQYTVEFRP